MVGELIDWLIFSRACTRVYALIWVGVRACVRACMLACMRA